MTAQTFPATPIRKFVPFSTGGPNDIIALAVADELGKGLGQNLVADNRAGARGRGSSL